MSLALTFNPILGDFQWITTISNDVGVATIHTETMTDSGDHQTFTAQHSIQKVFVLATKNGQYISTDFYTVSGSSIILTSPDANIASSGLEIVYTNITIGTIYTETLTDSGDHQTFNATKTIDIIFNLNTKNGQYLSTSVYSKSGSSIILSSPDINIANSGLELIYTT